MTIYDFLQVEISTDSNKMTSRVLGTCGGDFLLSIIRRSITHVKRKK